MTFLQEHQKEILEEKMLYARKENDSLYVTDYVEHLLKVVRADWLRSEIEKVELPTPPNVLIPSESPIEHALREGEYHALTSIITRYKEELLELEKGV